MYEMPVFAADGQSEPAAASPVIWPDPTNVAPVPPKVNAIAFQVSLTERGSQVQTFDYAYYVRQLLGLRVIILHGDVSEGSVSEDSMDDNSSKALVLSRWRKHFELAQMLSPEETGGWLREQGCFDFYVCLHGKRTGPGSPVGLVDGFMKAGIRVHLHAIFYGVVPWGSTFARVGAAVRGSAVPVVPLIVRQGQPIGGNLRQRLSIADNATVFCRYGGADTFNIGWVQSVVDRVSKRRPELYFVFLNTAKFCSARGNVIHLPAVVQSEAKSRFIRTCDAMLHARADGETFGLSVAEFSSHNKPVLTHCPREICNRTRTAPQRWNQVVGKRKYQVWFEHVRLLGSKAVTYADKTELEHMLVAFNRTETRLRSDWNAYERFAPEHVIGQFSAVFLQGVRGARTSAR